MKAKSIIISCILFLFTVFSTFGAELGDVNNDSFIDIIDALLITQFYVGLNPNGFDQTVANVNGDGATDIVDALLVAQYYVGLISWPPPGGITPNPTETPTPSPTPESGLENIINGDFANGTTNWTAGYYAPGAGSMSVSNEELHIGISDGGTETWNVQISQGGINITSGTNYTFTFDARSVSSRTIEANVGMSADPYTSYFASGSLSISTSMTTYSFAFTASANDATARVEFNCGLDVNDVYIDNVSLTGGSSSPTPEPMIINFPDPHLEAAIRSEINIPDGPIYNTDVYTIGSMDLSLLKIADITGLEHCNALTQLFLNNNPDILDYTPLENLTNLRELNIGFNFLSDITPLENLTNLTRLILVVNEISDITPLENLTNLTSLYCQFNDITDITPLENLTKLTYLTLNDNHITDITPLANLTKLTYLDLYNNEITDITPLTNLPKVTKLNLCGNPVSDITALGNLTNLTMLVLNVGILEDITPLANCTNLVSLNLKNNQITDITSLANLPKLKVLFLNGNTLNDPSLAVIDLLRANGVRVVYTPEYFQ
ncbi:MAG: leucine-rich repeat domain-containing protein [Spirochaetales bacterium]|nr:leucine-rich repeat domain-containing protein [Spirochaetales bacterium]